MESHMADVKRFVGIDADFVADCNQVNALAASSIPSGPTEGEIQRRLRLRKTRPAIS